VKGLRLNAADVKRMSANIRDQIRFPTDVRPMKYGNVRTRLGYMVFDSKREAQKYQELKLQELAGEIRSVVRQVSFPLPGHSVHRMRIDFMVIENDSRVRWLDSKGFVTQEWKLKRDLVEKTYGIKIETC
jgi:Protein of unknown function (DUF1064)